MFTKGDVHLLLVLEYVPVSAKWKNVFLSTIIHKYSFFYKKNHRSASVQYEDFYSFSRINCTFSETVNVCLVVILQLWIENCVDLLYATDQLIIHCLLRRLTAQSAVAYLLLFFIVLLFYIHDEFVQHDLTMYTVFYFSLFVSYSHVLCFTYVHYIEAIFSKGTKKLCSCSDLGGVH
jgi:hypothetical protein